MGKYQQKTFAHIDLQIHLSKRTFSKGWHLDNHASSLAARALLRQKSNMNGDCCLFKFFWRSVEGVLLAGHDKHYLLG